MKTVTHPFVSCGRSLRAAKQLFADSIKGQPRTNPYTVCETILKLSDQDLQVLEHLLIALRAAEKKHPQFAEGPYEALGMISAEMGELTRTVVKQEGEERSYSEALDVMVTAWRFARGDHK